MPKAMISPYYGKNDDDCDVGCGYISPYDVKQIIRFCSCRCQECPKYQELSDRIPAGAQESRNRTF